MSVYVADCREAMAGMEPESVDAIVCDPPYGLSFMGKGWDHSVPGVEFWREALRVAKPGAHLVAFGGTRTYHRLVCAIEDAGWEIRDQLAWLFGSGFPKSLDVSKAIDKGDGENRERQLRFTAWMRSTGITAETINAATGTWMGSHYLADKSQPCIATADLFDRLRSHLPDVPDEIERLVAERTGIEWLTYQQRAVVGTRRAHNLREQRPVSLAAQGFQSATHHIINVTVPATEAAQRWQGWGTALKPAHEPIVLARKPLIGTVAANVTTYGTGALNVDGCRIGDAVESWPSTRARPVNPKEPYLHHDYTGSETRTVPTGAAPAGRWPANVVLDEHAAAMLDEQTGTLVSNGGRPQAQKRSASIGYGGSDEGPDGTLYGDTGGASRFFYCAKASRSEREAGLDGFDSLPAGSIKSGDGGWASEEERGRKNRSHVQHVSRNHHPTVKPLALMRWLCRLITPPGGLILDPFAGSGTTGVAATLEGFRFIGCEIDSEYAAIAEARIAHARATMQPDLFAQGTVTP